MTWPAIEQIDAADVVIRFNYPSNCANTGTRTDAHTLMNHDQPRIARPARRLNPAVLRAAREIWLPIDQEVMNGIEGRAHSDRPIQLDWTQSICERFGRTKKLFMFPAHVHAEACRGLAPLLPDGARFEPSSGFLAIVYAFWCNPAVTLHMLASRIRAGTGTPGRPSGGRWTRLSRRGRRCGIRRRRPAIDTMRAARLRSRMSEENEHDHLFRLARRR